MGWQQLFRAIIIDRGYRYYLDRHVKSIHRTEAELQAVVCGNHDYHVWIKTSQGDVERMGCDCPYAREGSNCKHMVAVLFAVKDLDASETRAQDMQELTDIIQNTGEEELKSFLLENLRADEKLRIQFLIQFTGSRGKTDIDRHQRTVDLIFQSNTNAYGMIDPFSLYNLSLEIKSFLTGVVRPMINREEYQDAFRLVAYIYTCLDGLPTKDADTDEYELDVI